MLQANSDHFGRITRPRRTARSGRPARSRLVGAVGGTVMIGPKKLATIRQQLRDTLAATGDDPIRWLEELMNAPAGHAAGSGESEVLQSLRRFLAADPKGKRE